MDALVRFAPKLGSLEMSDALVTAIQYLYVKGNRVRFEMSRFGLPDSVHINDNSVPNAIYLSREN